MSFPQMIHNAAEEVSTAGLRDRLSRYLRQVEMVQRRYLITRHGQAVAALVPVADLHALEHVEKHDRHERDRRLAQIKSHQDLLEEAAEQARRGEGQVWRAW